VRNCAPRQTWVRPRQAWLGGGETYDAPDALAALHRLERAADLVERHRVRDERVHLEPAVHVPVDVARQVGPPARTAERRTAPAPAGAGEGPARRDPRARTRHPA